MCAKTLTAAMDWLERNHERGRCRWSSRLRDVRGHVDPHEPFDAPAFDLAHYADPSYSGDQVIYPQYGRPDYLSLEEHNHIRALYASLVTLSDRWLGHLLDKLDVTGLSENTMVLHMTDHGHLFGDHELQGKPGGPLGKLYEPTVHIPLMIRHPQGVGAGQRVPGLAQHVDVLPTVLDFLGVPSPEGVEGHSLLPLVRGEADSVRKHAFSGRHPNELAALLGQSSNRARQAAVFDGAAGMGAASRLIEPLTVTTEEWALICSPRGRASELYSLETDPGQTHNVIEAHPDVARELHAALLAFLETAGESGASEARIAPFRGDVLQTGAEPEAPAIEAGTVLYTLEDEHGTTIAFATERQARTLMRLSADAPVGQEQAGALRQRLPRALYYTPTQYYWLTDLL